VRRTALHVACRSGCLPVVLLLLSHGGSLTEVDKVRHGTTRARMAKESEIEDFQANIRPNLHPL